jgi:catechol 2,3-dioxygenase-like lactoylglutathione lyase family enzyme
MTVQALSHIGICVTDLPASARFYCEGLGFRQLHPLHVQGVEAARLLELNSVQLEALYLERDGTRIELLHFIEPGVAEQGGPDHATPRPMNRPGLTHLSLRSDDLDMDIARLEALGGQLLRETRIDNPDFNAHAAFLLDPDGTRIELVQMPGNPRELPGTPAPT